MNVSNCCFKCSCTALAVILSLIIGIFGAFFQFSGVFTVTTTFLWVTFGVAVGVLALLAVVTAVSCRCQGCASLCSRITAVLAGALGTILFSLLLLAVGIVATGIGTAILVGLVLFFFTLTLAGLACVIRCYADCSG